MKKQEHMYNIHVLARVYSKEFCKFLNKYKIKTDETNAFELFSYSMKKIYDIETTEYNLEIRKYGEKCIKFLSKVKGIPLDLRKAPLEERINLIKCCRVYIVVILQAQRGCN